MITRVAVRFVPAGVFLGDGGNNRVFELVAEVGMAKIYGRAVNASENDSAFFFVGIEDELVSAHSVLVAIETSGQGILQFVACNIEAAGAGVVEPNCFNVVEERADDFSSSAFNLTAEVLTVLEGSGLFSKHLFFEASGGGPGTLLLV